MRAARIAYQMAMTLESAELFSCPEAVCMVWLWTTHSPVNHAKECDMPQRPHLTPPPPPPHFITLSQDGHPSFRTFSFCIMMRGQPFIVYGNAPHPCHTWPPPSMPESRWSGLMTSWHIAPLITTGGCATIWSGTRTMSCHP